MESNRTNIRPGKSTKPNESGGSEYSMENAGDRVNIFESIYDLKK